MKHSLRLLFVFVFFLSAWLQAADPFTVQHQVKGNDVFVECMIPSISFRDHSKNKGKLKLYVDGKERKEVTSAAFIIKGLPTGTHKIKIVVVKPNGEPYGLEKEFNVTIP